MSVEELRVLYVEDSSMARGVVREFLEEIVGPLSVADNGAAGLAVFESGSFDMVITDIKMPVMDGFTMLTHIKKLSPDVKIIVVSAFKGEEEMSRMNSIGVDAFLKKPLELEELRETIKKVAK